LLNKISLAIAMSLLIDRAKVPELVKPWVRFVLSVHLRTKRHQLDLARLRTGWIRHPERSKQTFR
jgi:hypothetical protein